MIAATWHLSQPQELRRLREQDAHSRRDCGRSWKIGVRGKNGSTEAGVDGIRPDPVGLQRRVDI
jgi:hypothetical protein